jgi:mannan endo-1,4-beta-mannosidase
MDFVRVDGGSPSGLLDGGQPFRFVMLNAYYLQEEAARGRLDVVDETLAKCARMGAKVVRVWAFNDDPNKADTAIQRGRLVYSEVGLGGVDRVLERARAHGLRLILPLVDFWNSYGGVRQWLLWNGITDAVEGDPRFFTDPRLRDHYAAHVAQLLGRKNPLTGVRWGDDPTVLAWELMNEPRGDAYAIADWAVFAARAVRAVAQQLISAGEEGELESFRRLLACPDINLASCHLYPEKTGVAPPLFQSTGVWFLESRAELARAAGKPLYVGELGLSNDGQPLATRRAIYRRWLATVRESGLAGAAPWLFAYDSRPAAWDDFTFYWKDGTEPSDPANSYVDLLIEAAEVA